LPDREFAILVTSESKCRRITIQPWRSSNIRRVGTQFQANTRRGVFRVKHKSCHQAFAVKDDSCPSLGENDMKEATKRAASEALAQTLAVTAMLVIAGFVFYVR
jgi:hypothetical protein